MLLFQEYQEMVKRTKQVIIDASVQNKNDVTSDQEPKDKIGSECVCDGCGNHCNECHHILYMMPLPFLRSENQMK